MKKIEVTNIINEYLNENNLVITDLLNNRININSYEKYTEIFKLIDNTFKNNINEFSDEAKKFIDKMERLINDAKANKDDQVKRFIENNIKNYILGNNYSSDTSIKSIFISSLNNTLEKSESALKMIYKELGYDNLLHYIELLKYPNYLTSYLNDSQKQQVAMHYILFKTGHHSSTNLSRNMSQKNLYNTMKENIDSAINDITKEKDDFITFMNDEKNIVSNWFEEVNKNQDEKNSNYEKFMSDCNERINNLENMYSKKLKVEKPAEFMKQKSDEYLKSSKKWALASIGLVILLLIILGLIINPKINIGKKVIEISLFNTQIPIYQSIILLAMVCLIIYMLRVFIKLTISSKHLSEEYKQKYILTYFYLSLISEGKLNNELGDSIISKLFTKADTGLIKNDTNIEIESIYKTLTGINK